MLRHDGRRLIGLTAIIILLAAALVFRPDRTLRSVTAYSSHIVCSAVYISGLDPDRLIAEYMRAMPGMNLMGSGLRYDVDRQRREVLHGLRVYLRTARSSATGSAA